MIIRSTSKMDAIRAFINLWLKDPTWYCNSCGKKFGIGGVPKPPFDCCEEPQVGRNMDHTRGVMKQNAEIRKSRSNDFASTPGKDMRWGISLPPVLMNDLERYFRNTYDEKLFENREELHKFMKEFPQFRTCTRV